MQTAKDHSSQTDAQLLALAAAGEHLAFGVLYERYFDAIYDFAIRAVGDQDAAAAAVQGTFTSAWDAIRKERAGENVHAWLLAIARGRAIDERRHRRRPLLGDKPAVNGDDSQIYASPDPARLSNAQAIIENSELAGVVWKSAAALSPKQYSLLDMHVRRGLTPDEIAESLHLPKGNVYTMLTRLRHGLYESVTYQLLMRRGRRECAELDSLLTEKHATDLTRRSQRAIQDHLKTCDRCREHRRRYPSPLETFRGLALVAAAPDLRTRVWQNVSAHTQGLGPGRGLPFRRAVDAADQRPRSSIPYLAAAVGGVLALLAIVLAGLLILTSGGGATLSDPENVRPLDRELGDSSTDNVIEVEWDPQNNVQAYSVTWSEERDELPDTDPDLPGTTTRTESPRLDPGTWYFHLRTQAVDGRWTSTVHLGPFEVLEEDGRPGRTATPNASPAPTEKPTPVVTPNFGTPQPSPTPPPTPEPTPEPTPAPTPPPTPTPSPSPSAVPTIAIPPIETP